MPSIDQSLRDTKRDTHKRELYHILLANPLVWVEVFSQQPHFFFRVSWKTSWVVGVRQTRWEFWIDDRILRLECNIWSWSAFLTNWSIIRWNWLLPSPPFTLESFRTVFFSFYKRGKKTESMKHSCFIGTEVMWVTVTNSLHISLVAVSNGAGMR